MLSLRWLAVPVQSRFYLEFVYFSGSFINKASFRPNYLVYIESWLHLWNIVIEIPGTVTISVGVCMLVAYIITCLPVQKKANTKLSHVLLHFKDIPDILC